MILPAMTTMCKLIKSSLSIRSHRIRIVVNLGNWPSLCYARSIIITRLAAICRVIRLVSLNLVIRNGFSPKGLIRALSWGLGKSIKLFR